MRERRISIFLLTAMVLAFCCVFHAAGAETWYVENEWNYLDIPMDISGGIPEDADGHLAQIERSGVLRVAMDLECPPMSFRDPNAEGDGQYAGADVQLARLIAEKLGAQLVIVPMQPTQKLPAVMEEQVDLTISAVSYTPGRALSYTLSKAYYDPEEAPDIGILVREDAEIASLNDLENLDIAAASNSLQETFAAARIKNYHEFRRATSARAVFEMVAAGSVDAGIVSVRIAETYIRNNPDCGMRLVDGLRFSPESQYLGYRVAAKKGETQLIAFVNAVIDEALQKGLVEEWVKEAAGQAERSGQ